MGSNQSNPSKEESLKINALTNTITHILKFLSVKDCHNVASICKETSLNRYIYHIIFDKNPNIFAKFFLQRYIPQIRLDFYLSFTMSFKYLINPLEFSTSSISLQQVHKKSCAISQFLAKPFDKDKEYEIPLINASRVGNYKAVKALINMGANLEETDMRDDTSLLVASEKGNYKTVKILIKAGANIKKYDGYGNYSPFTVACRENCIKTVKVLLKNNIEYNQEDIDYAISEASENGYFHIVKILISIGANVNFQERFHRFIPIMYAIEIDCEDTIKVLLKAGANIEHLNTKGINSIMIAIHNDNLKILKILLNYITDINLFDYLNYAITCNVNKNINIDIIKELIKNGANINTYDPYNNTPLIYAAKKNNFELVKLLIQNGADICHKNNDCISAIIYAFKNRNIKMVKMLQNAKKL